MIRRLVSMAGIVIVGTVLLAGCAAPGVSTHEEPAIGVHSSGVEAAQEESASGGDGSDTGASGGEPEQAAEEDRAVIITGTVVMRTGDPLEVADAVAESARARSGAIDARAEGASTDFEPAWATLTVRVPAAEVDGLVEALRELAEVTRLNMGEQVVTNQVRDLEVRVDASRASVERLTELLATAADTETLLEVEAQLTQRTGELEQLLSQQRALEEQVAMSTLQVEIRATTLEGPTGTPSFWDGLVSGWQGFLAWGATFLFGLGQAIPALALLALVALLAVAVVRGIRRRMSSRASVAEGATVTNPAGADAPARTDA